MSPDVTDDNIEDIGVDDDADVMEYRENGNIHGYLSSTHRDDNVFVSSGFSRCMQREKNLIGIDRGDRRRSRRGRSARFVETSYLGRIYLG